MSKSQYFLATSKKPSVLVPILNSFKIKLQRIIKIMIYFKKFMMLFTLLKNLSLQVSMELR